MGLKSVLILTICIALFSCKTYTISTDSFKEQLANTNKDSLKKVQINNPLLYGNLSYKSNQIKKIAVINKKGQKEFIDNSPAIEMRITLKNNKKFHFYFDTVYIQNDTLFGGKSRFMPKLVTKIPFDKIQKIEVQDGGKNMKYTN